MTERLVVETLGINRVEAEAVCTVADVRTKLGLASGAYLARINGAFAGDNDRVDTGDVVTFTPKPTWQGHDVI